MEHVMSKLGVVGSHDSAIQDQTEPQISNFLRVRLQKQPDAWPEGISLPLVFDCHATKVFCPPWYWNLGPDSLLVESGEMQLYSILPYNTKITKYRTHNWKNSNWQGVGGRIISSGLGALPLHSTRIVEWG